MTTGKPCAFGAVVRCWHFWRWQQTFRLAGGREVYGCPSCRLTWAQRLFGVSGGGAS